MSDLLRILSKDSLSLRMVHEELDRGSDPNEISIVEGVSAMHLAAGLGNDVLGLLLQFGGNPNIRSREGLTPLHVSASYGDLSALTLLLHNGANANLQDEDGKRAVDLAMENNHLSCVEKLKMHTMLADVEDAPQFGKFTVDGNGFESQHCSSHHAFDDSFIQPEVLAWQYANTITQKVYNYLSEGRKVCFDATSPNTPLVGFKSSCCRSYCSNNVPNPRVTHNPHQSGYVINKPEHFCDFISSQDDSSCFPCPCGQSKSCSCFNNARKINTSHSPSNVLNVKHHCPNKNLSNIHHSSNSCHSCLQHNHCLSPKRCSMSLSSSPRADVEYSSKRQEPLCCCRGKDRTSPRKLFSMDSYKLARETQPLVNQGHHEKGRMMDGSGDCPPILQHNQSPGRYRIHVSENSPQYLIPYPKQNYSTFQEPEVKDGPIISNVGDTKQAPNSKCTTLMEENPKSSPIKYFPDLTTSDQIVPSESSLSRVAEYVLSCTGFSSQCSLENNCYVPEEHHNDEVSPISCEKVSGREREKISPDVDKSVILKENKNLSLSSVDSFHTATDESSISSSPEREIKTLSLDATHSVIEKETSSRWQPPTQAQMLLSDSIMTPDSSFVFPDKNKYFPKVPKMKISCEKRNKEQDQINLWRDERKASSELLKKRNELGFLSSLPKKFEEKDLNNSLFSTITVEEYLHTDPEKGITLIEKRIPSECGSSITSRRSLDSMSSKISQDSQATVIYDWKTLKTLSDSKSGCCVVSENKSSLDTDTPLSSKSTTITREDSINSNSNSSTLRVEESVNSNAGKSDEFLESCKNEDDTEVPLHLKKLSNEELSQELQKFGEIPGPVIAATRQVYLRRLASLELEPGLVRITKACPDYPKELRQALDGVLDMTSMSELENKMVDSFTTTQGRQWREGNIKSSFTYLLLDPRVTNNLPLRARDLSDLEVFKNFICAIFYIGKGKRARPYCHLYEAASKMNHKNCKTSAKVQHIIDIWSEGAGVVSLHCFQSVIPVEAYTREACMLEAIGMHRVTNIKRGDFYGIASTWPMHQRRQLGVYLLHKAMNIFLAEGERQICVPDLKSKS